MIKRLCLILCLVCGGMSAGENQKNSFFGIEGGVGLLDLKTNIYIVTAMGNLAGSSVAPTLGYGFGIYGGIQQYIYEKVGIRHTFGTKFDFGFDLGKFGGEKKQNTLEEKGIHGIFFITLLMDYLIL